MSEHSSSEIRYDALVPQTRMLLLDEVEYALRIYLDQPSQAQTWLLNPRFNVLPRIIQAVRPLVLPKLREENERTNKAKTGNKSKKSKGVKDVVHDDDFEVSIFLTDVPTRHSLLTKQKEFQDTRKQLQSNSNKLTGWITAGSTDRPIDVDKDEDGDVDPVIIRQESAEEDGSALNINDTTSTQRRRKRPREDSNEDLFLSDDVSEDEGFRLPSSPFSKRAAGEQDEANPETDDKKKLGLKTLYDGFSIYGRVLCLVVKRKGAKGKAIAVENGGQQMLENWVSTQAAQEQIMLEEE